MLDALISVDQALTLGINQAHNASADELMILISGKLTWIPLYAGILILLQRIFGWKRTLVILAFIVINLILTDQGSVLMKNFFERFRPCHHPDLMSLLHLPDGCGGKFGFVSSHAANTMGLAVLISLLLKNRWMTISMLAFAVANAYSRVYLGKHFVFDVVGGALFGALTAFVMYKLLVYSIKKSKV